MTPSKQTWAVKLPQDDPVRKKRCDEILKRRPETDEERQVVVCQYARVAYHVAKKMWCNGFGHHWGQFEDLAQEGMLALYKACDNWDADRGVKFISYAYSCVYHYLQHVTVTGLIHTPHSAIEVSKNELDDKFNAAIALACKQARNIKTLARRGEEDYQPCDERWNETAFKESLEEVRIALHSLNERQTDIIKRRLGLDGHEEETLAQVGDAYGFSKERARQIEAAALTKLKNWLMERDPEECKTQVARSKMFTTNLVPHPIDNTAVAVAPQNEEVLCG